MIKAQATNKSNGKNGSADTSGPTDIIPYDKAVREGQEIVLEIEVAERGQLRLGELAHKLEKKYGDRTLAKFAAEIGVAKCTLDRYQTVYRAWEGKLAPGPISTSYAVLRELATHPDREQIIRKNPNLTKREALALRRKDAKQKQQKEEEDEWDEWLKHNRKWFKELVAVAHRVVNVAGGIDLDECTPEQLENLKRAVEPTALMSVLGAGRRLSRVAKRLAELLGVDLEEASAPIERAQQEATAHVAT
jgi:hypothetical protein